MRLRDNITLLIMLLFTVPLSAQVNKGYMQELSFECSWDGQYDTLDGYLQINIDGLYCDGTEEGKPALPTESRLLVLPRGASIQNVEWTTGELYTTSVGQIVLTPTRRATVKDEEPMPTVQDKAFYATDTLYRPGNVVDVSFIGTIGKQDIYRVTVAPFAYNPSRALLQWYGTVSVRLSVSIPGAASSSAPIPDRYLIVSRPEFAEALQPFVQWKRQEGYEVEELYVNVSQRDSVKALMQPYFTTNTTPRYVLLVGDVAHIQSFIGYSRPSGLNSHVTDLPYCNYDGGYLPASALGRWPVADTAELRHVVEKTLAYERCQLLDTAILQRVLLVAGKESSSVAPTTTNGQVNYVGNEIANMHPSIDTICYYNPSSNDQVADILSRIRQGAAFLNYTAHCSAAGWTRPRVDYTAIDTLGPHYPMVYINNCCKSNDFSSSCFGSELLIMPQGGAVGVIGATNSTLWNEDYYWSVGPKYPFSLTPTYDSSRLGAFDQWLGRNHRAETLGEILLTGNLAVSAFGSPHDRFYWEIYCLFGDPSLRPYVGIPQVASLGEYTSIVAGTTSVMHTGDTPGATISVVQDDVMLGSAVVSDDGTATIHLSQSVDTGTVLLTASGYMLYPSVDTLVVSQPGRGLGLHDITASDSIISFTLANYGSDTLYGVSVALLPDSSLTDYTITSTPLTVDTLSPHQRLPLTIACSVDAVGQSPWWQARLTASADSLTTSVMVMSFSSAVMPVLSIDIHDANGNVADSIDLAYDYVAVPSVVGTYDSLAINVEPLPDTVGHLHVSADIYYGNWSQSYDYYLVEGESFDGFEQGHDCYPWEFGGTLPWYIDSTTSHSGRQSLRSGRIDYRQTSDLVLRLLLPHADSISFWTLISSEPEYDLLYFYIDGSKKLERWGDGSWKRASFPLSAGEHTLRWRYVKDESTSQWSDCAWLDDVHLPMALWLQPYGCPVSSLPPVSVSEADALYPLALYPNPASGLVRIEGHFAEGHLYDLYGRQLTTFTAAQPLFSVVDLPAGVYIVELCDASTTTCLKLIVNH